MSEAAKKAAAEMKLSLDEEKNLGFLIAMSKTNTEKITKEILEGLSEDTGDSESMMWTAVAKTPKIVPGDQAIQFMVDQLLKRIILLT
jgi:hypothetical protein